MTQFGASLLVHRLIYPHSDSKSGARLWLLTHCLTEAVIHPLTHPYFWFTLTARLTRTQIWIPSHPPIHILTTSPKHNNIHPPMSSPTYPITHSTPPHAHCLTYPLIHSVTLIYQLKLIRSPTHYNNKSPANSNIHSPIHSHTHSHINIINDSTCPQTHPIS